MTSTPREAGFHMPAEWEPQAAVWLAWPHHKTDFPGKLHAVRWTFAELARLISDVARVRLLVATPQEQAVAKAHFIAAGADITRVDFVRAGTNRSWTRDSLPSFVVRSVKGARAGQPKAREVGAVKCAFNGWGRYRDHLRDDAAGVKVARRFAPHWFPQVTIGGKMQRFVLEGGAIDVDGQGTVLTTERCLLRGAHSRNPGLGREGTEQALRDALGVEQVVWVPDGIAGDDTSGHIDDFCRFVAPGHVVLCQEPDRRRPNHAPLCAALECLKGQRDARGRALTVTALPMPSEVSYRGDVLPASYANFLIVNGRVLVPTFNDPKDAEALGVLRELMPKHEVVGVYCRDLVVGLGTIHCSTQQEPATSG